MKASCSARLIQYALTGASLSEPDREHIPAEFWLAPPDSRVALAHAHAPLIAAAERQGDPELGVKLGGAMRFGAGGTFDYAVRSAPSLREAVTIAERFTRLVADSLTIRFETFGSRALVRFDVDPIWPRVVPDFAMSAWFRIHLADQLPEAARLQCWFPYPAPGDAGVYRRAFAGAGLRFDAPFFAFALGRDHALRPSPGSDPVLHAIHRERAESLLAGLTEQRETHLMVRRIIERELAFESPTAERVAKVMHMSRSTLARRLAAEGTDFTAELDTVRRERALRHIGDVSMPLAEVAFRSGFRHVESFYRAFARWVGQPPRAYRDLLARANG